MMDPAYQDRNQAFGQGVTEPPSLQTNQAQYNARVPQAWRPSGLNQQLSFSGIGSSDKDKQRLLLGGNPVAGFLPSTSGYGAQTYQNKRPFLAPNSINAPLPVTTP